MVCSIGLDTKDCAGIQNQILMEAEVEIWMYPICIYPILLHLKEYPARSLFTRATCFDLTESSARQYRI